MNELLTNNNGRMPFVLNDIRFLDSIYRSAILAILEGMNSQSDFILYGITQKHISGDSYSLKGGVIYYNNELLFVSDTTLTIPAGYMAVIERIESYDSEGVKLFGDGVLRDTYKLVTGQFKVVLLTDTNYFSITTPRFGSIYKPNFSELTAFNKNFGGGLTDVEKGSNNPDQIIVKKFEIGPWDMDLQYYIGFSTGIPSSQLVAASGVIYSNSGTAYSIDMLDGPPPYGGITLDSVGYLTMARLTDGFFDSSSFSGDNLNRGYVVLSYIAATGDPIF